MESFVIYTLILGKPIQYFYITKDGSPKQNDEGRMKEERLTMNDERKTSGKLRLSESRAKLA